MAALWSRTLANELHKARIKRIEEWVEDRYLFYQAGSKVLPGDLDGERLAASISHQLFLWESGQAEFRGRKRKRRKSTLGCWCFLNSQGRQVLNIYRVTFTPYEQRNNLLEFQYKKEL